MGCTKRVSWHQRSLPCVRQKNIRTLDATPNTHTHTHTYNQSFMASEKFALRQSKEYTSVRRDTQHTHTHTHTHTHAHVRTTRLKRPQFGVPVHILKLLSSDLRHLESKRMPRVNNTHTVHATFCYRKISLPEERYLLHLRQKTRRGCPLHTHTVNDIFATAGNTLDCLTISFAHIHTFLTSH